MASIPRGSPRCDLIYWSRAHVRYASRPPSRVLSEPRPESIEKQAQNPQTCPLNRVSSAESPWCASQHCLLREPRSEERVRCQQFALLEQVDDGGDEVRDGVIDDYVTVVVSHLVTRRRWRQVAVDILGHRLQIFDVCVGIVAADIEYRAIGAIDLAHTG